MNASTTQNVGAVTEERKSARYVLGGSLAEGFVGGATIVLALIGLSGILPNWMLPIATIAMGAAFLIEGGAISARFSKLLSETAKDRFDEVELGVGVTSEFLGGVTGMVLGILALLNLYPLYLVPVAVIVYGAVLIFSSGLTLRLDAMELEAASGTSRFKKVAHEAMRAATGVEFLIGLSAVILGIIALTGVYSGTLSLVALLIVGVSGFLTGAAISAKMVSLFRA